MSENAGPNDLSVSDMIGALLFALAAVDDLLVKSHVLNDGELANHIDAAASINAKTIAPKERLAIAIVANFLRGGEVPPIRNQ